MAKILFFNVPAYGHVNPTLPVVSELVQRGHQVIYYNAESFAQPITSAGAQFRPYPQSSRLEADMASRASNLVNVTILLLQESLRLMPFLLEKLEEETPDLVIFDSIALWGMLAARRKNSASIASITTFVQDGVPGILQWRDYLHIFRHSLTKIPTVQRLRRQLIKTYGSAIFPTSSILPCKGNCNIVYTSRQFQPDTPYLDDTFHFVGPSILATTRKATDFPWESLAPDLSKIYLSLGTLYNKNVEFYRTVFTTFADHPAQFILSVGRQTDIRAFGSIPENFIVQASVPQLDLLQKVDLFITHGGMNSVNEGLNHGLPLLVVPQQLEQALNGRQVARHGAGIVLADRPPYGKVDATVLRQTVDKLLADPAYRQNAERLRHSFQAAGGYQQAATIIESRLV